MKKNAVVLFNLGGPDSLEAVEPFLFNLFNDKAIIRLPQPLRWLLAKTISRKRAPHTQEIYWQIGGKSPLLQWTEQQAKALEEVLNASRTANDAARYKTFISMRYWHPFAGQTAQAVKAYGPDAIILLPLYPQYSTTTTASSFQNWKQAAARAGLNAPMRAVHSYPTEPHFIAAHVALIRDALARMEHSDNVRILFSAHGLPEKIIKAGDPYQRQVEQTVAAIMQQLGSLSPAPCDYAICYQSRVGPLTWIGPSTEAEVMRAGRDGKTILLVPVSFVSEHSETLVELDIEYKKLAEKQLVKEYRRVPALGIHPEFILALAGLCLVETNY